MHISRDALRFEQYLQEIQEKSAQRDSKKADLNFDLSPDHLLLVERFLAREIEFNAMPLEAQMYCSSKSIVERRKDPFTYSELPDLLDLETWKPEEALQILAGIDPHAAILDWSYENFMGAEIYEPKIRHANCFADKSDLYDYPVESDFIYSVSELKGMIRSHEEKGSSKEEMARLLKDLEEADRWKNDETSQFKTSVLALRAKMLGILKRKWDSGDHDPTQKHSPVYFVRWAEKRGFKIEWTEWARKHALLAEGESAETPPYFDADSEDYPTLLHIAVTAWEYARKTTGQTPKQRILSYLSERYPLLKEASREAIATVGNWQKAGGRPKTGG